MQTPNSISLHWKNAYRIIPSRFPPINVFEKMVEPSLLDALFELECMTNERLRDECHLHLVSSEDRVTGPGATPIMAAFTHISTFRPSRFSDGSYGVYYAARSLKTAIKETVYHTQRFMHHTQEPPCELQRRAYINRINKPLHDIRSSSYESLHQPNSYLPSQTFAIDLKQRVNPWGLVYNSVRDEGGACVAVFRPAALTLPKQSKHLQYVWDGERIAEIYEKQNTLVL